MELRLNYDKTKRVMDLIELIVIIGIIFYLPFSSPTGFTKVVLVGIGGYLAKRIITKKQIYKYNSLDLYIFIWAIISSITIIFSSFKTFSLLEFGVFSLTLVFGLIVRNVFNSEQKIVYLFHSINISTMWVCFIGFYQAIYAPPMQTAWLDPNVRGEITSRVYSTLNNPNLLAIYLVLVIPIAMFMLFHQKNIIIKILYFASIAIAVACLGLTYSRTGMLGLVAAVLAFIALINIKYIIILLIGGVCAIPFIPITLMNRIKSIGVGDSTVTYRFKIWETTMDIIRDHPITGVGYGSTTYMETYKNYLGRTKLVVHAHNVFLEIWAETGIIGLLAFLLFLAMVYFKYIASVIKSCDRMQKLMLILGVSVITGFLVNGIAEHSFYFYKNSVMFFIVYFLTNQYVMEKTKEEIK